MNYLKDDLTISVSWLSSLLLFDLLNIIKKKTLDSQLITMNKKKPILEENIVPIIFGNLIFHWTANMLNSS